MSATSGITVSDDLAAHFSSALSSGTARFIKISIRNESLVHDQSFPIQGHFNADLLKLQDRDVLKDDMPAYVLARLDDPPSEWLAIFYVPDSARIRDKMLYASTRNSLLKALGSTLFTDSLFATSKEDLTPEAYAAHKQHNAAPKPLSAQEQELAVIREAESTSVLHQGTMARVSHLNTGIGFRWSKDVEDAVASLGRGEGCAIAIIQVEPANEVLTLTSFKDTVVESYAEAFPLSEPCYAFLAWPHSLTSPPRREIFFIYSCPGSSPIKSRMLYSSGSLSTFQAGKGIIQASSPMAYIASRRIETSDPKELDESHLRAALALMDEEVDTAGVTKGGNARPFPRPKRPTKKR